VNKVMNLLTSKKGEEFDKLSNYLLLKKDFTPWSWLRV